jgi:hypothetical protein
MLREAGGNRALLTLPLSRIGSLPVLVAAALTKRGAQQQQEQRYRWSYPQQEKELPSLHRFTLIGDLPFDEVYRYGRADLGHRPSIGSRLCRAAHQFRDSSMRINQGSRPSAVRGIIIACLISAVMWLIIAVALRGKTPIW